MFDSEYKILKTSYKKVNSGQSSVREKRSSLNQSSLEEERKSNGFKNKQTISGMRSSGSDMIAVK